MPTESKVYDWSTFSFPKCNMFYSINQIIKFWIIEWSIKIQFKIHLSFIVLFYLLACLYFICRKEKKNKDDTLFSCEQNLIGEKPNSCANLGLG